MAYAWQERPSARPVARSAVACDGREALAHCMSEAARMASGSDTIELTDAAAASSGERQVSRRGEADQSQTRFEDAALADRPGRAPGWGRVMTPEGGFAQRRRMRGLPPRREPLIRRYAPPGDGFGMDET